MFFKQPCLSAHFKNTFTILKFIIYDVMVLFAFTIRISPGDEIENSGGIDRLASSLTEPYGSTMISLRLASTLFLRE